MADNSVLTEKKFKKIYEEKIYPYLNGATHTGCVPLGTILPYFGETAPTHFLICDGTEYAKADYPELAEHLLALTDPTPYAGSDANHFKVPDLRGEFLRGTGTNSHANQGNGAGVGVHQDGTQVPSFFISLKDNTNKIGGYCMSNTNSVITNMDSEIKKVQTRTGIMTSALSETWPTSSSNDGYTSRPTNTSVTYIIAYRNAYIDLALDSFPLDITQPTDGQLLMYDATAGRWVNGGHKYSTDEHVVGKWIDGRNVYEITKEINAIFPASNANPNYLNYTVNFSDLNIDKIVSSRFVTIGINELNGYHFTDCSTIQLSFIDTINNRIQISQSQTNGTNRIKMTNIILQYIKTTDTV